MLRLLMVMSVMLLAACSSSGPYRSATSDAACVEPASGSCGQASLIENRQDGYRLAFVEIDEQGQFQDFRQVEALLAALHSPRKQYVTLFIHGWHHNAADGDENIESFKRRLSISKKRHQDAEVTGIYVGWRGESIPLPGLRELTFWDRKQVSEEVGRNALLHFLLKLELAVKKSGNPENQLVAVGHSFGGSVLFNALSPVLLQRLVQAEPGKDVSGFGDLVVLVNPAFEAMRYTAIRNASELHARQPGYKPSQRPVLLVATSETDSATGVAFPMGRSLNTLFEQHGAVRVPHRRVQPDGTPTAELSEWSLDVTAVGHFKPYRTHRLEANESAGTDVACVNENRRWLTQAVDRQIRRQVSDPKEHGSPTGEKWDTGYARDGEMVRLINDASAMQVIHKGRSAAYDPYWIIAVHKNVIPDHSSITQKHFWCFIDVVMQLSN